MRRAIGFGVTLLLAGGALAAASFAWPSERPALASVAALYVVLGFLVLALRPTHSEGDDVMVGFLLFRMPRLALGVAVAEDVLLVGTLGAVFLGLALPAWAAFVAISASALAIAGVGLIALAWSHDRGTKRRRHRAAGGLTAAILLALVPWAIRSVLLA